MVKMVLAQESNLKTDVADESLSQPHFFIDRGGGAFMGGWLRGVDRCVSDGWVEGRVDAHMDR